LVLDVAEGDTGGTIDLSREQELNQVKEEQVRLLWAQVLVTCLQLSVVDYLDFVVNLLGSEVLGDT